MTLPEPSRDCTLCPRLAEFRAQNRKTYPDFFNAPVPAWGDAEARLVIIGLAPGLKGANRTGRPFTGDYAGELLYQTLKRAGLAHGTYQARPDDGMELYGALIVNAVRCVPPENKPFGAEIATCRQFLAPVIEAHRDAVFLALGRIAHESFVSAVGARRAAFPFSHGARHVLPGGTERVAKPQARASVQGDLFADPDARQDNEPGLANDGETSLVLYDSFHCSRYNTNTGRLTTEMFEDVVFRAAGEATGR
jgi:uracil-DNA glycosylase